MGKLTVFNFISLDGYFEGPENGDISWHRHGEEEAEYSAEMLKSANTLLFGRITYELMAGYWPTESVIENDPVIAKCMNEAEKIVFSRTLKKAGWNNTKLLKDNIVDEIKKLKQAPGKDMIMLGSGSIMTWFADEGLTDEYRFMINPVAIGNGTPLFKGLHHRLELKLTKTRSFKNGNILLCYQPIH
jgi:dihydrofolate reductase